MTDSLNHSLSQFLPTLFVRALGGGWIRIELHFPDGLIRRRNPIRLETFLRQWEGAF
jgi:hypothetical protein